MKPTTAKSAQSLTRFLPYGRQSVSPEDLAAVLEILRSDWLTTGPSVDAFERALSEYVSASCGVAVSSGTAALHAALHAGGIHAGDEVIVPCMTFAATANAILYQGGTPVFADVDPDTLLVDLEDVERKTTSRTKAIVAVDYAGQPCDYDGLRGIARRCGALLIADGCHALGASLHGKKVGSLADMTTFSFHPVKHITTGEGGMVTTKDPDLARNMRTFRNHGITTDHRERSEHGAWFYEMTDLGFNYRITDFQCALGMSQLRKLDGWISRRQEIAQQYDAAFHGTAVRPLEKRSNLSHAYHLYVVRITERNAVFSALRERGIGTNVHYIPVYLHPYYREKLGFSRGLCPVAEQAYSEILTLPVYPAMTGEDVDKVIEAVLDVAG